LAEGATAPGKRLVLLDANALMTAARLKLDLGRELAKAAPGWTAVVPTCVAGELEGLKGRRDAAGARALSKRFAELEAPGRGDGAILRAAKAGPRRAVLTNDRELRKALRAHGIPVLYVRGRAQIALDGAL
jgi:rRNA-processing protein FCF1